MRKRIAFTLVELLVVISIIALLIAILLPSLASARSHAKKIVCQSRLRELSNALWAYSVDNQDRVPYVISPLTNGNGIIPGYGDENSLEEEIDPFDDEAWPESLPNILTKQTLVGVDQVYVCPEANPGYPRDGADYTMSYRPAAANQPNGVVIDVEEGELSYFREHFGFMDGRQLDDSFIPQMHPNPTTFQEILENQYQLLYYNAVFLRDMVMNLSDTELIGPHRGGINVISRRFEVEFRDQDWMRVHLQDANSGTYVRF